ncbi:MAG: S41 family peptidase [Bacteroidales bacterium]|nr:S41 family peptidase [Bacteroidales bacterium]MBD5288880.1 S41 family peptidase [Bacteroides sp.]
MIKKVKRITGIALIASLAVGSFAGEARQSHEAALSRNLNTFNAIVKELDMNYVDSLKPDESMRKAINALLTTIDPYTEYYNTDDQEQLQHLTTGEFGGIGSYIMQRDGKSYISAPMEGSPAARAGLKAGDHIIRIDTTDVSAMGSNEVTKLLRGQAGTTVNVTVDRPYVADSIVKVSIERAKIQEQSVPYSAVKGNTGYIRITSFIDKTPQEVRSVLEGFKENPEVKNIVLDLRGNGGGLVESAVEVVSNFVPKGTEVFRMRYKDPSQEKIYKTTRNPLFPDIPMAVLIDGATASASEITAGALQDLDRAVLVGSRSFGKGLVQSTRPLPYSGVLKITVAKYYIPSGRLVQALDWSHRNPDGSAARVPDSLTNVYHTSNGREVRDGGGLRPDSTVNWGNVNRLVYNAVADNWVFDFATKYAAEHPQLVAPEEFEISDELYADFKKSIDPEKFKYDKVCEEMMKTLRETAEAEGYMTDETKAQIDTLSKLLTHNLDHDLDTHRKEIEEYLGSEIASRYYYDRGKIGYELNRDKGFDKAVEILNDKSLYNRILAGPTSGKKKK